MKTILNPRVLNGEEVEAVGGKFPPPTISAAISEPLGISGRVFMTFPEYELATGWRFQTVFDAFQKSNMAAGKPEMR